MEFLNGIGAFFSGVLMVVFGAMHLAPATGELFDVGGSRPIIPSHEVSASSSASQTSSDNTPATQSASASSKIKVYTDAELLALAGNDYASGNVPLGDYRYVTDAPKKGYVYLCNVHKDNPGSMVNGPWMGPDTWNFLKKVSIDGAVSWANATFSNVTSGATRILKGNDLPINHTTGVFPVAVTDDAHQYDPNPNTISPQSISASVPSSPVYSDQPYCMGGEVGIMLSGVALFNAFDAGLRDAPAHELQDSCNGHPQGSGEYHYHSLPSCFKDTSEKTVLGYAYDGFPITGPLVAPGKYLTTDDLDECHGIASEINVDGRTVSTYHYVMTQDFPYSVSCFRGKPSTTKPSAGAPTAGGASAQGEASQGGQGMQGNQTGAGGTPPQEAVSACSGKVEWAGCSIETPQGTRPGTCHTPPGTSSLACVPNQ